MGKVHSIFKVSGKVGDYVYYMLNGKPVVRKAAAKGKGPKTKGEQERALYNREFGKVSAAGKVLRQALAEEVAVLNDRYLYQGVNGLMMQLRNFDPAAKGERRVAGGLSTEQGQAAMARFQFHKKRMHFPELLRATRQGGKLLLQVANSTPIPFGLLEMQINFDQGVFRKHRHSYPDGLAEGSVLIKRQFRSRKGFTDLVFVSGEGFLQGVVVAEEC